MFTNRVVKVLGIGIGLGLVAGVSQPAQAAIIGASGNAVIGNGIGADLRDGRTENSSVIGFTEQQSVTIDSPLNVDYLISGDDIGQQLRGVQSPAANPLTLGSGTYSSVLLHFDPVGNNGGRVEDATFSFSGDIVAIIANATFLAESDEAFGVASFYQNSVSRRSENSDLFTIVAPDTIRLDAFRTSRAFADDLRIITTAVPAEAAPEPLTVIGSICALGLGAAARRRQQAS
ncbi:MAG: PEP-CTERM sorting domain-containing protein [Cyanobacteria bacterium J06641_5]